MRLKSEALPLSSLVAPFLVRPLAADEKAWSTGARDSIHGLMSDSCCLVHRRRHFAGFTGFGVNGPWCFRFSSPTYMACFAL